MNTHDAFPRQPLASAHAFPLFAREPFAALCLDESAIVVVVIIIIFVVIIIVGYIGLELLSLLGHLLPLRPHVGDPAAELSVLGPLLGHVAMAVCLVVIDVGVLRERLR